MSTDDPSPDPERWERVRGACCDIASPGIDPDECASLIVTAIETWEEAHREENHKHQ